MTVNRTTLLDLPIITTGTESGAWGNITNNGLTEYMDIAIAGTQVLSTDADVTLTSTDGDSSATNIGATTAQYAILRWTASGSTTRNITVPAKSKTYVVINATGGTQSIVLRGAGPTTGVTIIAGEKAHCVWNGSDFVKISSSAAAGGSNTQVQYNNAGVLAGSSNLTFDGTNLGVGTSSPSSFTGYTTVSVNNATNGGIYNILVNGTETARLQAYSGVFNVAAKGASTVLTFETNGSERMRLDSSGNLGLGVTPSAWTRRAIQLNSGGAGYLVNGNGNMSLGRNIYFDGSNKYINTGAAAMFDVSDGSFQWYTAPSGTAGNAISFTQAMTLDASGNLLVGGTSNAVGARLISENASGNQLGLRYSGIATYYNSVDASGNLIWTKDGSERARIDSSGNLLVGATTNVANERLNATKSVADYVVRFINSNATPYGLVLNHSAASPNGTGNEFLRCVDSTSTDRMTVRSNGGIANYSANNVNLSDRREKTNFSPAKSYLDTICAIPVQTFNYIDQSENDPGLTLGVVAQDVQAVAPELVMESNWGTKEEPKMRLSIYQTDLQYALMKCIQEQQALIQSLTARVAALEGTQP